MKIEQMNIADVKPYERNPRINDNAVEAVAESIKEFGWQAPVVGDQDNVIICGHTRLLAAKHLGLETVPVHVAKGLTPEQVRAYRITDNKTGEIAEWDYDLLNIVDATLRDYRADAKRVYLTGFYDEYHLSKTFKKQTGLSPRNFKNM
jgi:ParB-like chromosome segregation protein Spo0J